MGRRTVIPDDEDEIEEEVDVREKEKEDVDIDQRDDDGDQEDEEEEGQDEYEKDGFIVDDVEDDEEEEEEEDKKDDSDGKMHRKKKKRRETEKNYELDEDDYALLEDNNITGFHRSKPEEDRIIETTKMEVTIEKAIQAGYLARVEAVGATEEGKEEVVVVITMIKALLVGTDAQVLVETKLIRLEGEFCTLSPSQLDGGLSSFLGVKVQNSSDSERF